METAQGTVQATGRRQRVTIPLDNLERGGGAGAVETLLGSAVGVRYVYVNAPMEMTYIEYDPLLTDPHTLASFLSAVGFGPL